MYFNPKKIGLLLFGLLFFSSMQAQEVADAPDNEACLKCHSNTYYSFFNEDAGKDIHKRMNPYFIINNSLYNKGVHNTFTCTDCHNTDYEVYPHDAALKLEMQYTCQDCHGGDENFAKFHFDEIEVQVQESIHGKKLGEEFTCEMCHNPHYYELNARNKTDIVEVVDYSNQMCLSCHNFTDDRFYMMSDSSVSINKNSHSWLPNLELHLKKVRCIECHATYNDSIMVSHDILPKEQAVKLCVDCHSDNSILMSSLYRHQAEESRNKYGFFNGLMMNDSFVIGANRNYYLNAISIGIFSLLLLVLAVHAILRIILKK